MNWSTKMWLAAIGAASLTIGVVTGHVDSSALVAFVGGLALEIPSIPENGSASAS